MKDLREVVSEWLAHVDQMDAAVIAAGGRPGTEKESSYRRIVAAAREAMEADAAPSLLVWRHNANEWADELSNAIQGMKNVRDGVWSINDCLSDAERGIARCRELTAECSKAADAAPSDAEIEAIDLAIGALCDDCRPDGSVDPEVARAIGTLRQLRRARHPQPDRAVEQGKAVLNQSVEITKQIEAERDRAVEALRGLVEAVDKLRASENTERRKGYLRAFADDDLLGDLFDAASAAKEVLCG